MSVLHEMLEIGRRRRGGTRPVRKPQNRVGGKQVSIQTVAQEIGAPKSTLRYWMKSHHCSLEEAAEHYRHRQRDREYKQDEEARRERAAEEILGIIMEG